MKTDFLTSLEHVCWALGTLAAIVAAWFQLRSTWLSKPEDREALQAKYRARWQMLRNNRYLELPERGVRWLLGIKGKPREWSKMLLELFDKIPDKYSLTVIVLFFIIPGPIAIWILYGPTIGIVASIVALVLLALLMTAIKCGTEAALRTIATYFLLVIYSVASCFFVLQLALSLKIYWTALLLMGVMPFYALLVLVVLQCFFSVTDWELSADDAWSIGFAFTVSFFITAIALFFGSVCSLGAYIPQTIQMFLVNVFCDGLTLLLTFIILEGAIDRVIRAKSPEQQKIKRKYPILVAIALDFVVAALLACLSLYFGLLGSDNALSITETVNVLIARAPSGTTYELGPYFWAMHTTFIPTALYLVIIMLAYIGKLIILPVFHVLKKGHELDKPHDLSAAVLAFVAALFLALAGLLSRITP